ncbi:putative immunity protein [Actinomycetospora sp. C-140]
MSGEITDADRRAVAAWAVDVAERALPLFTARVADDDRPRRAIDGARAFADGVAPSAGLRASALAALAAAREAGDPVATAAARSAGYAAATAFLHPRPEPHQVRHVLGPAVQLALAADLAGGDGDDEIDRALGRAAPAVRDVVRRLPADPPGRTRRARLSRRLDDGLRG